MNGIGMGQHERTTMNGRECKRMDGWNISIKWNCIEGVARLPPLVAPNNNFALKFVFDGMRFRCQQQAWLASKRQLDWITSKVDLVDNPFAKIAGQLHMTVFVCINLQHSTFIYERQCLIWKSGRLKLNHFMFWSFIVFGWFASSGHQLPNTRQFASHLHRSIGDATAGNWASCVAGWCWCVIWVGARARPMTNMILTLLGLHRGWSSLRKSLCIQIGQSIVNQPVVQW